MPLYRGLLLSSTEPSADVVFADSMADTLVVRLRGGYRQEVSPNGSARTRSTLIRPDYVITDQHGTAARADHASDFSATLPGTLDVVIHSPVSLDLTGVLALTAQSEPITIEFSLQQL